MITPQYPMLPCEPGEKSERIWALLDKRRELLDKLFYIDCSLEELDYHQSSHPLSIQAQLNRLAGSLPQGEEQQLLDDCCDLLDSLQKEGLFCPTAF